MAAHRKTIMIAERERIATAVADLVLPEEVLKIGAGATTFHVARHLAAKARGGRGVEDADDEIGAVYRAMIKRAAEAIVVADHSKFEQRALTVFAHWIEIDRLVTDEPPVDALAEALRKAGTEVVIAQSN
jgi:DeoR/GlpR family transcriptional regulator of sugar metabolism